MSRLHYRTASDGWLDALPLGNGRIGAMVEATDLCTLVHLNDETAWSGSVASEHHGGRVDAATAASALAAARDLIENDRPVEAERELAALTAEYSQAYLPFGRLQITLPAGHAVSERWLDLATATHHIRGTGIDQTSFVSAADGVLVHRLTATGPAGVDVTVAVSTPLHELARTIDDTGLTVRLRLPADVAPGHRPDRAALVWDSDGITPVQGALTVSIRHDGRLEPGGDGALRVVGASEVVVLVATDTTFVGLGCAPAGTADNAAERSRNRIDGLAPLSVAELAARHRRDHGALYDRVSLQLTGPSDRAGLPTAERLSEAAAARIPAAEADPGLVALLFDYGRYLLIASSRPAGLPATLQGLWNASMRPPWSSNYTLNINTEMNYWAAQVVQLDDTALPLLDLVEALAARGAETAERLYGCRGWVAHHNSDAWAFSSPVTGDASWAQWPMAGPWLVRQLDEPRRFGTADAGYLARLWPVAAGCARFCLDFAIALPDGRLGTRPSTSPENRYRRGQAGVAVGTASGMDRTLLRELFTLLPALAADSGHADDPVLAEVAAALDRIDGVRIDADGRVAEWGLDEVEDDPGHRHLSHLVGLYPGDGLPAAQHAAVGATLDRRGDDSTGWSLVWKLCLRARLGQAGRVGDLLGYVLRPAGTESGAHAGGLYPNFFAAHPPFQIDGNLGFVAAIAECLVQSHTDVIDLLPALPPGLENGRVTGLAVRGGLLVDLDWADGEVVTAVFTARPGTRAGSRLVRVARPGGAATIVEIRVRPGRPTRVDRPGR
ncbi:glycoside hydrolase family 95 protein [Cryobacterium lactosi]|uniref:Glycoside hydrolase family 95 protein n=1 Tax=Cryobacterium lactosi TaxID=1259202 RepID=A0A4R9BTF7_9MICO|nr:glycoside hydrolase N-terminal domain-containing protein [Cryobacterium lactosi]TFD90652.1 glycoside hydrolase family 95 protein [Cryobacterium lactosi]